MKLNHTLLFALTISFVSTLSFAKADIKSLLSSSLLHTIPANEQLDIIAPIALSRLLMPINSKLPKTVFQGNLTFTPIKERSHLTLVEENDVYQFERRTRPLAFTSARAILPNISFDFVQSGNDIIPLQRGLKLSKHHHWDYIIGVGNIWQPAHTQSARITLPFALIEKNQNCVHNGILSFLVEASGEASNFYYQISSETCQYFKADLWGKGRLNYKPINYLSKSKQANLRKEAQEKIAQYQQEKQPKSPTKSLQQLFINHPQLNMNNLALTQSINVADMSSYGVLLNGTHYVSDCFTRYGNYPFCSQLILPSYSTAKSIFAGLAMLYLETIYPNIFNEKVSDWVAQCNGNRWKKVTFSHLLNMVTGNYDAIEHVRDESAEHSQKFFKAKSKFDKTSYSCHQFKRKSQPGETFVYHTSDTYLLGVALDNFLRAQQNKTASKANIDLFNYVFVDKLWPLLELSPVAYSTRRTLDKSQQAFTGYGLFFLRDDIAKLMNFINQERTIDHSTLNQNRLISTLQKYSDDSDFHSKIPTIRYKNGFWKQDVTALLSCKQETWLPYMLGYGGIAMVFASTNMQYYYFSDSDQYNWRAAIKELDKIAPLCR